MFRRFDIMPQVSIIGPSEDLLLVLRDLHEAFTFAEEYHEEYQQWESAYQARIMRDALYKEIAAIEAGEIINSRERPGERGNHEHS